MKTFILTLIVLLSVQTTFAQDEALRKDILKVIDMNGSSAGMKMAKNQILKMIPADKQAAFLIEFDASLPAFYDKIVKVYMETYTKEDIKAMMEFYNSPVGKKMASKSDELMEKSQAASVEWGQGLQAIMVKYM